MRISDWSSDVCSSDLLGGDGFPPGPTETHPHPGPPGPAQRAGRSAGLRGSAAQAGHPHPLEGEGEMLEGKGEQLGLRRHALVAIGGGKDSLVSIEALRKVGVEQIGRAHSELQSLMRISYAVFCLKKKN